MPTLFEKIIAGEIPATIVHKDERVTAFRDIRPQAPVHVLIVPNKPIPTVNDIADEDERLSGTCSWWRGISRSEGIAENGFRLIVNCNEHGGQEVYHLHMHLLGGAPLGPMLAEENMAKAKKKAPARKSAQARKSARARRLARDL